MLLKNDLPYNHVEIFWFLMLSNNEADYFSHTLHHLPEEGSFLFANCFKIYIQNLKAKVYFFNRVSLYTVVVHQENWKRGKMRINIY